MKKTISLILLMISIVSSGQDFFNIGTNTISLVFADTALSETNKILICTDMNNVFAVLDNPLDYIEMYTNTTSNMSSLRLKQKHDLRLPEIFFNDNTTVGLTTNNTYTFTLSKKLTDYYCKQFILFHTYSNAFSKINGFIDLFRSGLVTNLPYATQTHMVFAEGSSYEKSEENITTLMNFMVASKPVHISILDFEKDENLVAQIRMKNLDMEAGDSEINLMPIIYHDNKWKIYVWF